jgi:YesN/AraC family two-component response regulator
MNKISILIVEDELNLLKAYSKYISLFCEFIYTASNGEEALELYYKNKPDIILTDINMPKFDGMQFIQKVRETDKNTKIIILSAHTETKNLLKAVQLNLVSYLVKPVKMSELKSIILQTIEEVTQRNILYLHANYTWNKESNLLKYKNETISLTGYENAFVKCLVSNINQDIAYEELHNYIYLNEAYSLSAISSLVKRIRKKTSKELIKSSFKFGYKIESLD